MSKNIQISVELFKALLAHHLMDSHSEDAMIRSELERKLNRMVEHELYTEYKTNPSEEEKENARQQYLDKKGIHAKFRR